VFREKFTEKEVETSFARLRPEDREQLFEIGRMGGDHWQRTLVSARLSFPDDDGARAASAAFEEAGFTVEPAAIDDGGRRHVVAEIIATVPAPNVEVLTNFCLDLAERNGGTYDGWDVRLATSKYGRALARQLALEDILQRVLPWRRKKT
jgi:hypothetical protein